MLLKTNKIITVSPRRHYPVCKSISIKFGCSKFRGGPSFLYTTLNYVLRERRTTSTSGDYCVISNLGISSSVNQYANEKVVTRQSKSTISITIAERRRNRTVVIDNEAINI